MIIIVDSGSSKSDWVLCDHNGRLQQCSTIGLNPVVGFDIEVVERALRSSDFLTNDVVIDVLFFYGAGCARKADKNRVRHALQTILPKAKGIRVESDLLGAAHACFGKEEGAIAILGTGSIAGVYDGEQITYKSPSFGYLLSDEGGGFDIGRRLLRHYIINDMPDHFRRHFEQQFDEELRNLMPELYKTTQPNAHIASFAKGLDGFADSDFAQRVVTNGFNDFFDRHVDVLPLAANASLSIVGSIAHAFEDTLRAVAAQRNRRIHQIFKKPMDGLVQYHLKIQSDV